MSNEERAASMSHEQIVSLLISYEALTSEHDNLARRYEEQAQHLVKLQQELDWFKRQLFGAKSERRVIEADVKQLSLGELPAPEPEKVPEIEIPAHRRRRGSVDGDDKGDLRFDESVPVERIKLAADIPAGEEDDWEQIGEKTIRKLAQRPGTYVVLEYVQPVFKRKAPADAIESTILCAAPPISILERSFADVSLLAGLLIDKFIYHLPLYRQHQRMAACGVHVSRGTLTHWVHGGAEQLVPLYDANLASILASDTLAMDETPIKAGRKKNSSGRGQMATGYFWPLYGDRDEVAFHFAPTRSHQVVFDLLKGYRGTLLSDGYDAYARFSAKHEEVLHACCWAHTRRGFEKALSAERYHAQEALERIGELYDQERELHARALSPAKRLGFRAQYCKPIVEDFFEWLRALQQEHALLPSNLLTKALAYAIEREAQLKVFLEHPDVPVDTNHLERAIRPIALGRRNWLFCWTEVGAKYAGIIQSLLSTCRLHGVDPYTYLVDVFQRIQTHPARRVDELIPRLWKENFGTDPMRSDLDLCRQV